LPKSTITTQTHRHEELGSTQLEKIKNTGDKRPPIKRAKQQNNYTHTYIPTHTQGIIRAIAEKNKYVVLHQAQTL